MEYFTVTFGYGFKAEPEMFQDWTHLTPDMIRADFADILSEYMVDHAEVQWVDFGSKRKSPNEISYYIMARESIRYCDGLIPAPINMPTKPSYDKALRESIHKLNVKEKPGWHLGMYEW